MCDFLQNSRWIKYWLLALSQSDCRILARCIIMVIMTIAIWFAQKDTSNKFPHFNLFTYLRLGCWSINCIWYSQLFSNRVRNYGYASVYYTSYHNKKCVHYVKLRYQRETTNHSKWVTHCRENIYRVYTKKYCTSHAFLSCRYCVATNFVNTSNECWDWPRHISVFIGVNRFTQVKRLMINHS